MNNRVLQQQTLSTFREPVGKGPYFVPQQTQTLELNDKFVIIELRTSEAINQLYTATVRATIPTNLAKKSGQTTKAKTTEEFCASQMLKHVTICLERPDPTHVPKELFQLKTYFHGVLTSTAIEVTPQFDVVEIELRPYLWLLTQQNNYRSFDVLDAKEILTKVFQPYQTSIKENKFNVEFICDPMSKRIQTLQKGETDFEFVIRLMEEEGLSYFYYHNDKTATLVITHKVSNALTKTKDKFPDIKKNLSYFIATDPKSINPALAASNAHQVAYTIEGLKMPLWDFRAFSGALPDEVKATAYPDYRDAGVMVTNTIPQDVHPKSEAFKIQPSLWLPTTQLVAAKKTDKDDFLKAIAAARLSRNISSKVQWFGKVRAYGFFQIWRACDLEVMLSPRYLSQTPTDYESVLTKTNKFYPSKITQHFVRTASFLEQSMNSAVVQINQNLPPVYHKLDIALSFLKVDDDSFKPPLIIPRDELSEICKSSASLVNGGLYSAAVVEFKNDDKTEKSFDVPNTHRIRLPWHKDGESVKARVSTFWASDKYGSLFIPEVGTEVIVAFLEGDPDYPVILGSCYNSKNDYPLDVTKREAKGTFGARGIIFKDATAEMVFKTVKANNKDIQVLSMLTTDGNISITASQELIEKATQVSMEAKKICEINVTEPGSTVKIDENGIAINGTKGDNTLTLKKGGTLEGNAKTKINLTATTIAANGMEVQK